MRRIGGSRGEAMVDMAVEMNKRHVETRDQLVVCECCVIVFRLACVVP